MIDIIIPIYNTNIFLDRLLDSIRSQSYSKYTIYLIDANSKEKYNLDIYSDLPIRYIKLNTKTPPGLTRQVGLNYSSNKYVMFIDQDDELTNPNSLELLVNNIKNFDIVSSGEYYERDNVYIINDISLHGKLFKRSFLTKNNIKFNDYKYHEDVYFNNACFLNNAKIIKVDEITYFYHNNLNSIVNTTSDIEIQKIEYLFKIIKLLKKEIPITKNNIKRYKELCFKNYDYFLKLFPTLSEEEKNIFASYVKKYDKENVKLMLSNNDKELKININYIFKHMI